MNADGVIELMVNDCSDGCGQALASVMMVSIDQMPERVFVNLIEQMLLLNEVCCKKS